MARTPLSVRRGDSGGQKFPPMADSEKNGKKSRAGDRRLVRGVRKGDFRLELLGRGATVYINRPHGRRMALRCSQPIRIRQRYLQRIKAAGVVPTKRSVVGTSQRQEASPGSQPNQSVPNP